VQFKGENYFLSGSQDGYLNKWHMESDWRYADADKMKAKIACLSIRKTRRSTQRSFHQSTSFLTQ
jgi:hypothetical protein